MTTQLMKLLIIKNRFNVFCTVLLNLKLWE